jgi:diguanylate cyclase (GGDEF)-like protein/PAS domain S-box-containing protein
MRNRRKVIIFSGVVAVALWIANAAVDAFVYRHGRFIDLVLFDLSAQELYIRSAIIAGFMVLGFIISRTALHRNLAQEALHESEETLHTITDSAKDAIVMMDDRGTISFWNRAAEKIFGYNANEATGRELHALLTPQRYQAAYEEGFRRFQGSGEGGSVGRTIELMARRKDGVEFPVELSLSALQLKGKWHAVGVLRDISERKKTEEELRTHRDTLEHLVEDRTAELHAVNELLRKEIRDRTRTEEELYRSESFLNTIFDSFHDPFSIVDRDYTIVKFNDAYLRAKNRRARELFGKTCYVVMHNRTGVCDECVVEKTFQSKDPWTKEKQITLHDGSEAWVEIYTYPIFDQKGDVSHVVEYTRDITDRKKEEEERKQLIRSLNHLSITDSLTGLFNRRALNDMLTHEIDRASRYNTDLSLILCDVDNFKAINDTHGHTAGDRALQKVAETLKNSLRRADILGRYGGDEFMIILPETGLEGAKSLAEKVRIAVEGLELELELPGQKAISLSLSLGVASCCEPLENIDTLVSLADTALYASKQAGRNKVSTMHRR